MYQKRQISLPVGTKPRDQKQETGNDCDFISGLKALLKTDFPDIFWLWAYKLAKMVQKCTVYKKIRSVPVLSHTQTQSRMGM